MCSKTLFHETKEENKHLKFEKEFIMEAQKDETLAEAVRKFSALYEKCYRCYREGTKTRLTWEDVGKETLRMVNFTFLFFILKRVCNYFHFYFRCV